MMLNEKQAASLKRDIYNKFKIQNDEWTVLEGGFLNLKWRVGGHVVKVFSKKRFKPKRMKEIEYALSFQAELMEVYKEVPNLLIHENKIIQEVDGLDYMVMTYFEGEHKNNESVTLDQLVLLGKACASVHHTYERNYTQSDTDHYKLLKEHVGQLNKDQTLPQALKDLLPRINENMSYLPSKNIQMFPLGITHSDFSDDNILFGHQGIQLLDFDRCRISYIYQDIGRAIMSFTFNGHYLESMKLDAFYKGYCSVQPIEKKALLDALVQTWIVEVPFWMLPEMFDRERTEKLIRFRKELIWLTQHLDHLEEMVR